jgi:hypothetical protein
LGEIRKEDIWKKVNIHSINEEEMLTVRVVNSLEQNGHGKSLRR